jgi:hypothetical protein
VSFATSHRIKAPDQRKYRVRRNSEHHTRGLRGSDSGTRTRLSWFVFEGTFGEAHSTERVLGGMRMTMGEVEMEMVVERLAKREVLLSTEGK